MKPGKPLSFALLVVVVGCAEPFARAPRIFGESDGLLYSNSLVLEEHREPHLNNGALEVDYTLLFENVAAFATEIDLVGIDARVGDADNTVDSRCHELGHPPEPSLLVPPGEHVRMDCTFHLTPAGMRLARRADTDLAVHFPVNHRGWSFLAYRFKVEDAS